MTEVSDLITLRGLSAVGNHGVYDFERSGSQVFSADLTLHVDSRRAAQTDDVQYTVDYAQIADAAVGILTGQPVYLLETLAHNLAEMALSNPQVLSVEVTIHKPMAPVRHQFTDVSVTIKRDRRGLKDPGGATSTAPKSRRAVLSLGSNLGDSESILTQAVGALMEIRGLEIDDVSPLVVTAPVLAPGQSPQPNYHNAVVLARTILSPVELLKALHSVEHQFGRTRDERWAARTLDIDIIDVGGAAGRWPGLELPHPRAQERAFVLYPWSLVAPEAVMPDGRKVADLARVAPDRRGIVETRSNWLRDPGNEPASYRTDVPAAGPPAVLQVPPPPHSPARSVTPAPVEAPAATSQSRRAVTIRGNEVNLEEVGGDFVFQRLLRKEWTREVSREAPRPTSRSTRIASTPEREPSPPMPRRRAAETPVPPPPAPEPVLESPVPQVGEPELHLPDWRPVRDSGSVRIVDAVEVGDAANEGTPSQGLHWRRVVRPTPTGMMPLLDRDRQKGRQ